MTGSSKLTGEQADWYLDKFGVRYRTVQETPLRPSRRVRRAQRSVTKQDVEVAQRQHEVRQALAQNALKAKVP